MLIHAATFLLLLVGFLHLFLFVYNRWLLCITDGPWKNPIIGFSLIALFLLPIALLVSLRHHESVSGAMRLTPDGTSSQALFVLLAIVVLFWATRVLLWCIDKFFPDPPPQLVADDTVPVPVPPVFSSLPRALRPYDTTGDLHLTRREVIVSGMAPVFDGMTIAQVSDIHFGQRIQMANYLEGVHALVQRLAPDLVVFTGDFVDQRRYIQRSVEYHARFRGRLGTFCVLGNHDYWTRPDAILAEISRTHIRWLGGGERRAMKKNARRLVFTGTDSPWDGLGTDWRRRLRRGTGDAVILLSHTPDNAPMAARNGASLVLSGHNHGGQVCLPWIGPVIVPSRYGVKYAGGVYRAGSDTVLNVSRGVGVSSGGVRILCPPEICLLTLRVQAVDVMAGAVQDMRDLISRKEESSAVGGFVVGRSRGAEQAAPFSREVGWQ
ncbi:MAG: metallophosphoesterase [Candidatus Sumerlaeia bacterium]|nr:metallophosphoesterase [Candidatus Sumerlaeia bacterium]